MTVSDPSGPTEETPALGLTDSATVVRGGAWNLLSAIAPVLQTLAISVVAARYLGPHDFGVQSFIAFVSVSCVTILAARMPAAFMRFGAELLGAGNGGMVRTLFGWTWRVQLAWGAATAAGLAVAALAGADPRGAWALAGISAAMAIFQTVPSSLLVAAQRWRESIVPGVSTTILSVPATIVVLAAGGGITGYFAVEAAIGVINLLWTAVLGRRLLLVLPPRAPVTRSLRGDIRRFVSASMFFAIIELVVWRRSEFVFLAHFSTATEVGFYSIGFAAATGVGRLPSIIARVSMPAIATLRGAGEHDRVRSGYWRAVRLLAALSLPLVAVATALGSALVDLAYGSEFAGAKPVLVILLAPVAVLPIMAISDALLWTLGRLRFLVVMGVIATGVNIGLAFVLIPAYDAVGAAIVNVAAQLVAGAGSVVLAARIMAPSGLDRRALLHAVALALVGGITAWLCVGLIGGTVGFFAALAASAGVLWLLGGWLGMLSAADTAWVADALGTRLGGRAGALVRRFGMAPAP